MIVTDIHVFRTLEQSLEKDFGYLTGMLKSSCEEAFGNKLINMMWQAAPQNPSEMERNVASDEFHREAAFLITALGPLYEASGGRLPMVTKAAFDEQLRRLPAVIGAYDKFIAGFRAYNVLWSRHMRVHYDLLARDVSKILMGATVQIFVERLPSSLEPWSAHIYGQVEDILCKSPSY